MTHPFLLLLLLAVSTTVYTSEEDFAFDSADDLEVEFEAVGETSESRWAERHLTATVGRAYRLKVPPPAGGSVVEKYEIKPHGGKRLPPWLLFDRKSGIFWGVPLQQDIGVVPLTVRAYFKETDSSPREEELKITVVEREDTDEEDIEEICEKGEYRTVLTLMLEKDINAIKPKQRVVAINNVARFFGLPYSAFTLHPIINTAPSSKDPRTTALSAPVGCAGRLWVAAAPAVKQLKERTGHGMLTEVIGVPVKGWRVGVEHSKVGVTDEVVRRKRAPDDDYGSGDYDEEYYDYDEDYKDEGQDDLSPDVVRPPSKSSPSTSTSRSTTTSTASTTSFTSDLSPEVIAEDDYEDEISEEDEDVEGEKPVDEKVTLSEHKPTSTDAISSSTSTTTTEGTTHAHRHHHGELVPNISSSRDHHTTHKATTEHVPSTAASVPSTPGSTSSSTTKKTDQKGPDYVLNYDDYGIDNYDEDYDGEDYPVESKTIVPDYTSKKKHTIPPFEDTESITTEEATVKTTTKEVVIVPVTSPATTSSTTSSTTTVSTSSSTTVPPTTTVATSATTTTTTTVTVGGGVITTIPAVNISENVTTSSAITTTSEAPITATQFVDEVGSEDTTVVDTEKPTTVADTTIQQTVSFPSSSSSSTSSTTVNILTNTTTEAPTTLEETTYKVTTVKQALPTIPSSSTTVREVTDVDYHENVEPFIENRLKQMSVTAGKIFRFVIPFNTFKDFEDDYNLTYELLDSNNRSLSYSNTTWLHFNPYRREVYGLPLEEDVSKWVFWVKATDRDGGSVREKLNIQVQQHKLNLIFNHEFALHIRIEKPQEFPHYVDWSLKALRALGKIYNTNMSEITVRKINYLQELVVFTWSNDTLPTNYCPKGDVEDLYKLLTANDHGDPSRELNTALAPELRVKKVTYRQYGVCEPPQTPVTQPMNFSPLLRNPVDHVNATVGELLIFKVKDDTFYDHEDVDPRMLNITLLTADRKPIPLDNWLQFDSKNREFFGIPRKAGRTDYQLVCIDSGGLEASDSLEVIVDPPPKKHYNVEFSMNITELPYQTFVNSASMQKKFVEKLMVLFGEKTPNNFHFLPFKQSYDSIIVTWFNKSLPTNICPHEEIKRLQSILLNINDKSIAHRVHAVMEPDFKVSTIKVHTLGNCKAKPHIPHEPTVDKIPPHSTVGGGTKRLPPPDTPPTVEEAPPPVEDSAPQQRSDEYLLTFIVPAVIIAIMLFLASVAAIVLYRRRRMGKMNVEEDGRGSYGNKGIPVIFQEELEEKPESGTKAPVILKDEKPPLAPPEYSKSGSVKLSDDSTEPYRPPPAPQFVRGQEGGGRQSGRPKPQATPTYRKPPPYVPP